MRFALAHTIIITHTLLVLRVPWTHIKNNKLHLNVGHTNISRGSGIEPGTSALQSTIHNTLGSLYG